MASNERDEVRFEIVEKIGVLNSYSNGWNKELNLVAWNGNSAKYDLRDWDPNHEHMSRGITLHAPEALKLGLLLEERKKILEKACSNAAAANNGARAASKGDSKEASNAVAAAASRAISEAAVAEEFAAVN
ncbi:MAG: hypothetical protein K6F52_08020 [Clostridia bacterium]|nr:hypothetical protein [Clostridia bacterium]